MTRTRYYTATTLDGYLADEHDSLDWLMAQDPAPEGAMSHATFMADVGAAIMGATTYRWVLDHLEGSGEAWDFTVPVWVMTHRDLPVPEGADVRFAAADDEQTLRRVHAEAVTAAGSADVWVVGGGGLAADLAAAGLLDELMLAIAPVTLGAGRPLFPRPFDLRLVRIEQDGPFACAWYEPVGPR